MRRLIFTFVFILTSTFLTASCFAEEGSQAVEPQITIRHEEEKTFYEYRINGVLKEIKVVPSVGPVYYLVPADGNAWIREDRSQVLVPKWVLFEW